MISVGTLESSGTNKRGVSKQYVSHNLYANVDRRDDAAIVMMLCLASSMNSNCKCLQEFRTEKFSVAIQEKRTSLQFQRVLYFPLHIL
jgi:hypothetical protein